LKEIQGQGFGTRKSEVKSTGGSKICDIFVKRNMVNSAPAIIDVSLRRRLFVLPPRLKNVLTRKQTRF
jgi:hypothetical protein